MKILVVEDDQNLARHLAAALSAAGYLVDVSHNGEEGHYLGDTQPYDASVLDLGLPGLDGISVLKRWRSEGRLMPVLILTARGRWTEKVAGLDAGADDYLTKPFETEECLARLRALIRRSAGLASAELECGPIRLDTSSGRVTVNGILTKLTAQEYKLLSFLMHRRDQIVSRTDISEHIYHSEFDLDSNTIDVFVGRLRKKLGSSMIETVRGLGYRLTQSGDEA
jgi:two-component system OmpR family response regulator